MILADGTHDLQIKLQIVLLSQHNLQIDFLSQHNLQINLQNDLLRISKFYFWHWYHSIWHIFSWRKCWYFTFSFWSVSSRFWARYEYGFAGRPGNSMSADYYAASQKEFTRSYSHGHQQPGNIFMPDAELGKDNDLDDSDKVSLLNLPPFSPTPPPPSLSTSYESAISITV